jgi:hypothetical protein
MHSKSLIYVEDILDQSIYTLISGVRSSQATTTVVAFSGVLYNLAMCGSHHDRYGYD